MAHDILSVEGILTALAVCFAIHVAMVPLGLDALAHTAGHALDSSLTNTFASSAVDPTFTVSNSALAVSDPTFFSDSTSSSFTPPTDGHPPVPCENCHFDNGKLHCGPH